MTLILPCAEGDDKKKMPIGEEGMQMWMDSQVGGSNFWIQGLELESSSS